MCRFQEGSNVFSTMTAHDQHITAARDSLCLSALLNNTTKATLETETECNAFNAFCAINALL